MWKGFPFQGCGINSKKLEMVYVGHDKFAHLLPQKLGICIWCKQLFETEHTMLFSCKVGNSIKWNKQSEISIIKVAYMYIANVICFPLTSRHHSFHIDWADEHRDWTLTSQCAWSQVLFTYESSVQPRVWHPACSGIKGKKHSKWPHDRTGKITVPTRCVNGMGRNQHRWTYGHAYYPEWHFDNPKVCRQGTQISFRTVRCSHSRFFSFNA